MGKSKIEWTDRVWNTVTGCSKISPGCDNCYAERMSKRFAETWGLPADDPFKVTLYPERLEQPLRWTKPSKVFVCSMADLFHDDVSFEFTHEIWDVMKSCPQHTFLVLTKRPEKMKEALERIYSLQRFGWAKGFWNHVWLGVTAENQEQADKRIPILLQISAAKRFVSVEPMLSEVKILNYLGEEVKWNCHGDEISRRTSLDWVICGGESGPGARPMHPDWARSLRDQCKSAGVPFFFKQWGEWAECPPEFQHKRIDIDGRDLTELPGIWDESDTVMQRVGKKKAGCLLDGQEWKQYPRVGV